MSERLPYEMQLTQQWIDLPLPDENMAWADMRRRLEEDDDKPVIAWWRRGCAGWGALLLVLLAIGWWWVRPEKWFTNTTQQETPMHKADNIPGSNNDDSNDNKTITTGRFSDTETNGLVKSGLVGEKRDDRHQQEINTTDPPSAKAPAGSNPGRQPSRVATPSSYSINTSGGGRRKQANSGQPLKADDDQHQPSVPIVSNQPSSDTVYTDKTNTIIQKDILLPDSAIVKKDSVKKEENPEEKPPAQTARTDSSKKKKIFFSAGLGEYQQIPLSGQKLTPYSASGRKGSLADYIPSVFFRINRENKWFIQAEFRYGAPQYTKEFQYLSKQSLDTINQMTVLVTTNATLKKTFYHQLPVTFNYYVRPNWSIGAGLAWNKFSSAVSDVEILKTDPNTQIDSVLITGIQKVKKDSVFSSSYFHAVLETQYKWKRFSFGARYMFGLQPYIKFTLPGGRQQQERNSSLQVFLRYELWRSKNK
jgi:hypothetical protein